MTEEINIPTDWKMSNFGSITTYIKGYAFKSKDYSDSGTRIIRVSDTTFDSIKNDNPIFIENDLEYSNWKLKKNDLVFTTVGSRPPMYDSMVGKVIRISQGFEGCLLNQNAVIIRASEEKVDPNFLFNNFKRKRYLNYIEGIVRGNANQVSITLKELFNFKIPLPPLPEQQKIAEILNKWDLAISTNSQLLIESLQRKKGLEQRILSGKNRFPEFVKSNSSIRTFIGELPEEWELKHISDITQRVKKSINPEPETLYREIGIRSHCKGIFHKEEVTGASLGNKSVFWIQPDCFVVNIVFAWEHAIAKTTEAEVGMIASHRFPMYEPKKDVLDLDYLLYYFKTARGKHLLGLASPGGAGRNKTLGQGEFAKLKIPVPSLAEQKRIVAILSEADREIELLKQQIATLKEQKQGLMQKLLTGEIRIKTDN